jgi:RNA-dependent RNA polymerase
MFCRFTTCLDSRKTGHLVQQEVFKKDVKKYANEPPNWLCSVKGDQTSDNPARRGKGLGPFILDILEGFGGEIHRNIMCEYEHLKGKPGASGFEADHDLLGPYRRIVAKLSEIESLPGVHFHKLAREARTELKAIESHVEETKTEWGRIFGSKASKSARNRMLVNLRRKFESGPDGPHLSHLGDIAEIRASYAYRLCCRDVPRFAFNMAFDLLCKIKALESRGTILSREFADLVTVPKIAVRTLSALRSGA